LKPNLATPWELYATIAATVMIVAIGIAAITLKRRRAMSHTL